MFGYGYSKGFPFRRPAASSAAPLDGVTNLKFAFSEYRKLVSAYAGNSQTIREGSGNTAQAFGFSGSLVDWAAKTTFLNGAQGYMRIANDQSGNGNNATQTVSNAQQPKVAATGGYLDRPTMLFDGTMAMLTMANGVLNPNASFTCGYLVKNTNVAGGCFRFIGNSSTNYFALYFSSGTRFDVEWFASGGSNNQDKFFTFTNTNYHYVQVRYDLATGVLTVFVDGVSNAAFTIGTPSTVTVSSIKCNFGQYADPTTSFPFGGYLNSGYEVQEAQSDATIAAIAAAILA